MSDSNTAIVSTTENTNNTVDLELIQSLNDSLMIALAAGNNVESARLQARLIAAMNPATSAGRKEIRDTTKAQSALKEEVYGTFRTAVDYIKAVASSSKGSLAHSSWKATTAGGQISKASDLVDLVASAEAALPDLKILIRDLVHFEGKLIHLVETVPSRIDAARAADVVDSDEEAAA